MCKDFEPMDFSTDAASPVLTHSMYIRPYVYAMTCKLDRVAMLTVGIKDPQNPDRQHCSSLSLSLLQLPNSHSLPLKADERPLDAETIIGNTDALVPAISLPLYIFPFYLTSLHHSTMIIFQLVC